MRAAGENWRVAEKPGVLAQWWYERVLKPSNAPDPGSPATWNQMDEQGRYYVEALGLNYSYGRRLLNLLDGRGPYLSGSRLEQYAMHRNQSGVVTAGISCVNPEHIGSASVDPVGFDASTPPDQSVSPRPMDQTIRPTPRDLGASSDLSKAPDARRAKPDASRVADASAPPSDIAVDLSEPDLLARPDAGRDAGTDAPICTPSTEIVDGIDNDCDDLIDNIWRGVFGGDDHACGYKEESMYCWGGNEYGQLGNGVADSDAHTIPELVTSVDGEITPVRGSSNSVSGVLLSRILYLWGRNDSGQLGIGTTDSDPHPIPRLVDTLLVDVADLSLGGDHVLARAVGSTVHAWGRNDWGQLGDGTTEDISLPVEVIDLDENVIDQDGSENHSCFVVESLLLYCSGKNDHGQLGIGAADSDAHPFPEFVSSLGTVVAVAVAGNTTFARTTAGDVYGWGDNTFGQLGDGTTDERWTMRAVQVPEFVVQHDMGQGGFVFAVTEDGKLYGWGRNDRCQLGIGSADSDAHSWPELILEEGVQSVALGAHSSYIMMTDGRILTWGDNYRGQLGDGTTETRCSPGPIALP